MCLHYYQHQHRHQLRLHEQKSKLKIPPCLEILMPLVFNKCYKPVRKERSVGVQQML